MNLTSPAEVSSLLRRYGLHPRKRWGQNFLIDRNTLNNVLRAADVQAEDQILEIGPGLATLTGELAMRCRRVVAVEIDPLLVEILRAETLADLPNVEVVERDALQLDLESVLGTSIWKVVANIPYYITTPLIERLLEVKERLDQIVLMVQQEVANRLVAMPGTDDYGSLSVFVQYHTEPELVGRVSRNAFLPPPGVDSAIVRLRLRREGGPVPLLVRVKNEALFFQVVRAAFQQRRKTLLNALSSVPNLSRDEAGSALEEAGIAPSRRGETLGVADFARIADAVAGMRDRVSSE